MEKYHVANADIDEIPILKRIEVDCGLSPWTVRAYESEFLRSDSVILKAASDNGEIVGFLVGRIPLNGCEAEIYNLGIEPPFRRHGIATMLLREFQNLCFDRQITTIWLEVRAGNAGAIDFYRTHQFAAKGVRQNFYSDPAEDAVVMCALVIAADRATF